MTVKLSSVADFLRTRLEKMMESAGGRMPGRKASIAVLCVLVFLGLSSSIISSYFGSRLNGMIKAEIDRSLPDISRKLGLHIRIGAIDSGIISGPEIRDVRIAFDDDDKAPPFLSIPRLSVDYSLSFTPPFRVRLTGITMTDPVLTVREGTADSVARLRRMLSENGGKPGADLLRGRAGRLVELDRSLHADWKGAKISVAGASTKKESSPYIISRCRGTSEYDTADRKGTLDIRGQIGEKAGELRLHADIREGQVETAIHGQNLKLAELAAHLPGWIVLTDDASLSGRINLALKPDESRRKVKFEGELKGLGLDHWRIADKPLKNISLHTRGVIDWNEAARLVSIESSQIGSGKVAVNLTGKVDYRDRLKIDAALKGDRLDIQDILKTLPREFIPTIYDAGVAGQVDLSLALSLDLDGRHHVELEPDVHINDFRIVTPPRAADIGKLKKPFYHRAKKRGKIVKEFWVGPSNPDFVPYDRIGKNVIRAALTCEDGRFFHHDGFQVKHIKDSMRQNLREKRFARGASTISMQTAKNLFLSGNKTISRKFEEMLLTYAMEQELSKERILEIYMNIIEWGPDIYGVGRASRYYFDKKPKDLTLQEAAFLGSIIANPVRYHYMYKNGEVTDAWSDYISLIISKMHADREEVESIQSYKPEFGWVRRKRLMQEKKAEEAATPDNGKNVSRKGESPI